MTFAEYPKQLVHPQHRPAVIAKWDHSIKKAEDQPQGLPERFPSVVVYNLDQEQEYAAKGYVPSGKSDPEAYRRAMTGNEPKSAAPLLYPKWLYRRREKAASEDDDVEAKLVATEAEERAAGAGWHPTPDAARNAPAEVKAEKPSEQPRGVATARQAARKPRERVVQPEPAVEAPAAPKAKRGKAAKEVRTQG
jgi:hypothetical protein